jgi:hypothetical protein
LAQKIVKKTVENYSLPEAAAREIRDLSPDVSAWLGQSGWVAGAERSDVPAER